MFHALSINGHFVRLGTAAQSILRHHDFKAATIVWDELSHSTLLHCCTWASILLTKKKPFVLLVWLQNTKKSELGASQRSLFLPTVVTLRTCLLASAEPPCEQGSRL